MKRGIRVIIVLLVIITMALLGLSLSFASTQSNQLGLLPPRIDVEATARAIQLEHRRAEVEKVSQERLLNIKAQINQKEEALSELEEASQTQGALLGAQLATLQDQIAQYKNDIEKAQAALAHLQEAAQENETNAQDTPATDDSQLPTPQTAVQQSLPTVSTQLQLTAEEQAPPPAAVESPHPGSDESNEHSPDSRQNGEGSEEDGDERDRKTDADDDHESDRESHEHDNDGSDRESHEHDGD